MKHSTPVTPEILLRRMDEMQNTILSALEKGAPAVDDEFITEKRAKEMFQRKSTWFWKMRKEGLLPYSKIGKSIYYSLNSLRKVFQDSRQ
jgi:hypothetical protein